MRKRVFNLYTAALLFLALVVGGPSAYAQVAHHPRPEFAGAAISGNPKGATDRVLAVDDSAGSVKRVVYFAAGSKTMTGANTPVSSSAYCGFAGRTLFRSDVYIVGTMAGTNPTLSFTWQHSIDGGTNWVSVGTWTAVNATVTPASESQTVSDVWNNSTAVALGDCWRMQYTMGGTGTVVANFEAAGIAK